MDQYIAQSVVSDTSEGEARGEECRYLSAPYANETSHEGKNHLHRVYPTCETAIGRNATLRRKGKRKLSEAIDSGHSSPTNKDTAGQWTKSRTRLTMGQKLEILELQRSKVQVSEIARRYSCGERTVYSILKNKGFLEGEAKSSVYKGDRKTLRSGLYPQVDDGVAELMREARKHGLPITQGALVSFAGAVKTRLLLRDELSVEKKIKLKGFRVSEKWVKNFARRQGIAVESPQGELNGESREVVSDARNSVGVNNRLEEMRLYEHPKLDRRDRIERMHQTYAEERNQSSDRKSATVKDETEAPSAKGPSYAPSYDEVLSYFDIVEEFAESNCDPAVALDLRKVKAALSFSYAAKFSHKNIRS